MTMKKSEVFILRGLAQYEGTAAVSLQTGDEIYPLDLKQNTAVSGFIVTVIPGDPKGVLCIGGGTGRDEFSLVINSAADMSQMDIEWAVAKASDAFYGQYECKKLYSDTIVFTAEDDGFKVEMKADTEVTDDDAEEYTENDLKGDIAADLEILGHYADSPDVLRIREEISAAKDKSQLEAAEKAAAELIQRTFSDITGYREIS